MAETEIATVSKIPPPERKKYEELCDKIVKTLEGDGPQRVLLTGEAGIGKTWMAKKVEEKATKKVDKKATKKVDGQATKEDVGLCYQTLWLHLNKKFKVHEEYDEKTKFEDEWTLYQSIASQLCLYSDFEETEVGDRDEDEEEEKKLDVLLKEIKLDIKEELLRKKNSAEKLDKKNPKKSPEDDVKAKKMGPGKSEAEKKLKNQAAGGQEKPNDADNKSVEGENKEAASAPKPYLLLILDDEGMTTEDEVMVHLGLEDFLKEHTPRKILITRRQVNENATNSAGEIEEGKDESHSNDKDGDEHSEGGDGSSDPDTNDEGEITESVPKVKADKDNDKIFVPSSTDDLWGSTDSYRKIEFPTIDESQALLESFDEKYLVSLFQSLFKGSPNFFVEPFPGTDELLTTYLVKKSKNLPAAVVVLAKSLECTIESASYQLSQDEEAKLLKKKIEMVLSAQRDDPSDQKSSSECATKPRRDNPILRLAYELLKTYPSKDAILDCFWHSLDFFEHCGSVYYRDLITQWILEGYFDPVRSVETAYQDGHLILMELIDRGLLKIQENNVVVPEMAMKNVIDPRLRGHLGRSRLGFSRVYGGNQRKGIGKITQIDDMIKTVQAKKSDKISTILVSGDRLRRVTPKKFFKNLEDLEVLGLFEPTMDPFVPVFVSPLKLRVLIIRDCDLLEDIEELKALRGLHALEVSGASSLKKISDEFFKALSKLQSLHLSGLQITSSPSSISELTELHCLIIRDCPLLEDLPDIQELVKLEVVDVSGARGLQTCFDNTKGEKKNKSKNKNFYHLTKLQLLDFSESQIERLPIFQDSAVGDKLRSLTRLLLRNCSKLRRLPSLKPLSGLQILDLSGTTSLVEMLEVCFEDKKELKTLNLSGTNLSELATTIEELSNLNKLLLKDCTNLEVIPNIQNLTNLEVIDVSGCTKLHTIEGSFEDMSYLCEVNLSGTKVKTPELPKKTAIICLKHIILADGRRFEGEDWSEIRDKIESKRSDEASSSDSVVKSNEISEKGSEEIREEIQPSEAPASDSTEKGDVIKERLRHVPIERDIYKKVLSRFDSASQQEVMKIHKPEDLQGETPANAEFVSFEDIDSAKLKAFFSETKSVKGCSLRMCRDIKNLFFEVDEESLGSLETLSIINFPLLETICWGGSFKNLKKLSIDCCPNIKMLFPEASQLPSSLEELNIKYCEKLEKVVVGVELSSLTNLKTQLRNCPKLAEASEGSDWVMVERP